MMAHTPDNILPFAEGDSTAKTLWPTAEGLLQNRDGDAPVHCLYPQVLAEKAEAFVRGFPGGIFYAVKANPHRDVLRILHGAGIDGFEVASVQETRLVRSLFPEADIRFMHPVKSAESIALAYALGVRVFALDSGSELEKILTATGYAPDLTLVLRMGVPGGGAAYELAGKFGMRGTEAVAILRAMDGVTARTGITFHVGSECLAPAFYTHAVAAARALADEAGVAISLLDVGGGFPVPYPGIAHAPLAAYFKAIEAAAREHFPTAELCCEPGRALVAEAGTLLVRVEMKRGDALYINDGTYGGLFDAGVPRWRFPVRCLNELRNGGLRPYRLMGPTCDSLDMMEGPFYLPADIDVGDWIEVQVLGAYSQAMRTSFNGFEARGLHQVGGQPAAVHAVVPMERAAE